jgi:hypothetical protein
MHPEHAMSNENPTRPAAPDDEKSVGSGGPAPAGPRQGGADPRMEQGLDNIGVDDQGDLLDPELDDQPGDQTGDGPSFMDDVRSDSGGDGAIDRS